MPFIPKMRSYLRNIIFRGCLDADLDSEVHAHFVILPKESDGRKLLSES